MQKPPQFRRACQLAFSTTCSPTPALRQQAVQNCQSSKSGSAAAPAQALAAIHGPGKKDHGQALRTILQGAGLRENDAAYVLVCYRLIGWSIVHNVQDNKAIIIPMAQGVRSHATSLLAGNAQLRTMPRRYGRSSSCKPQWRRVLASSHKSMDVS